MIELDRDPDLQAGGEKSSKLDKLQELIESDNIAESLNENLLNEIAAAVVKGFDEDYMSTEDWRDTAEKALELTELKRKPKHTPMRDASNVKYPLITTAVNQITSRTPAELVQNGRVAKYLVVGRDPNGAKQRLGKRVTNYLNYQILHLFDNWMDERERLISHLAVVGTVYTKTWYDPIKLSPKSELIPFDEIVVNDNIKSLDEAERVTQVVSYSVKEIVEFNRHGLFTQLDDAIYQKRNEDNVGVHEFLEQHCWLDLDEDGYPEPYIVTLHKESNKIARIEARFNLESVKYDAENDRVLLITPQLFFTDYHFIPNPNGRFHSIGFGTLLYDLNTAVNTTLNQLIDAGRLANKKGGIISDRLSIEREEIELEPGEFKTVSTPNNQRIADLFYQLDYGEPSSVLFQLLGVLIDSAKSLTSTTDSLTGTENAQNTSPNTLFGLIKEGLRVYTAIQRRIFRGHKKELDKLVTINRFFFDPQLYLRINEPSEEELQELIDPETGVITDFFDTGIDILPVADAAMSTEVERLAKANSMLTAGLQAAGSGAVDVAALLRRYFEDMQVERPEELAPPKDPNQPDPAMIQLQSELDMRGKQLEMEEAKLRIQQQETLAKIAEIKTKAMKNLADAEAAEVGQQLDTYFRAVESSLKQEEIKVKREQANTSNQNGPGSVATRNGNQQGPNGPSGQT